jgi:two-component system LytT family sensor kinase
MLTPVVLHLAARFPLERDRWLRNLSIHLFASLSIATCQKLLSDTIVMAVRGNPITFERLFYWLIAVFDYGVLIYWVIVHIRQAFEDYRKVRERELRASQLETQLVQAQLQVLKGQLQPHFLFNTLHAISSLMHRNTEAADEMMNRLGNLLRFSLESNGAQEVPLRQELEALRHYLDIEQVRLGDRLTVRIHADPSLADALVPHLVLQPLVENAIRHGINKRARGGRIEVCVESAGGRLRVRVSDDGVGLTPDYAEGVGLGNTRARLHQLYGSDHSFEYHTRPEGGLAVTLLLPLRTEFHDTGRSTVSPSS